MQYKKIIDMYVGQKLRQCALLSIALICLPMSVSGNVIWSEEFNSGSQPDSAVWSYDLGAGGWGNSELQEYTNDPANVSIANGYLSITAREKLLNGGRRSFTSGRIKTEDKLTFKYGTLEARISVPNLANGLWPAFWTLGNNFSTVGWPNCGELDVMEMGSEGAINDGVVNRRVGSAAHWEHNGSYAGYGLTLDASSDLHGSFHVYRMEWTPIAVSTYIDNKHIWTIDLQNCSDCEEFHQPHFVLLNLAVGGSYTGLFRASDITAPMPAEMRVDYVRISDNGYTVLGGSAAGGGSGGGEASTQTHVESIMLGSTGGGPNKKATALVTVKDENGAAVADAKVTGTFAGSHNSTVSAVTNSAGEASLVSSDKNSGVSFEFCVDGIQHSSLTYNSSANTVTCASY